MTTWVWIPRNRNFIYHLDILSIPKATLWYLWKHAVVYGYTILYSMFDKGLWVMDPASISHKTSYCKITHSLEASRFELRITRSFWNFTSTSAALLPICQVNFKAMRWFKLPISRLRNLTMRRFIRYRNRALVLSLALGKSPAQLKVSSCYSVSVSKISNTENQMQRKTNFTKTLTLVESGSCNAPSWTKYT